MPILKQCSGRGCTKIVAEGVKYCTSCYYRYVSAEKERHKKYSRNRRNDKEQKQYQDFYSSKAWLKTRDTILSNCYNIDIFEFYRTGRIIQGYTVHHIVTLEDDYDKRLDISNLIYLTQSNHIMIHKIYEKGKREREQMERLLREVLRRWNEEWI